MLPGRFAGDLERERLLAELAFLGRPRRLLLLTLLPGSDMVIFLGRLGSLFSELSSRVEVWTATSKLGRRSWS